MKFKAQIDIMPMEEILDPQGKTVNAGLHNMGLNEVQDVRIGKHVRLVLDAESEDKAREVVDTACKKLLANLIMERYEFRIEKA
jgi:phosphoribosylformylglycinamidine synthase subunit PurS